jgi:hypothetical protein
MVAHNLIYIYLKYIYILPRNHGGTRGDVTLQ